MRALRTLFASGALLAAVVASGLLYAYNEDGNVWNWGLWRQLSVAAILATASFLLTRRIWPGELRSLVVGALFTYVLWLGLLLAADPSGLMWLPVIILFGIPFTAPILAAAWFASGVFSSLFAKPNDEWSR